MRPNLEHFLMTRKGSSDSLPPVSILWCAKDMNLVGERQIPLFTEYFDVRTITILKDGVHLIAEEFPELVVDLIVQR